MEKKTTRDKGNTNKSIKMVPAVLIIAGLMSVFAGYYRGETDIVLRKAINICLECIGIG